MRVPTVIAGTRGEARPLVSLCLGSNLVCGSARCSLDTFDLSEADLHQRLMVRPGRRPEQTLCAILLRKKLLLISNTYAVARLSRSVLQLSLN